MEAQTKKLLNVEFFQVEMPTNADNSCSACNTVQDILVSAIQDVQHLFDRLDCEIQFKQTTISTKEEAEKANISASPTIRVGNLDFYPNHLADNSEAREWKWNKTTLLEPNKETLIEVLLKGYFEPEKEIIKKELSPYILKNLNEPNMAKSSCGCS